MKTLIWQNVTEGSMTNELKEADIILLSEGAPWRTRLGRRRCKQIRTKRLKGLIISVKRDEFKVLDWGFRMFHLSGQAEGWNGISTPARGVLWIVGYWLDDPEKNLYFYSVSHFLNSWDPAGKHDRWTHKRYEIVTEESIPVVEDLVADKKRKLWLKQEQFKGRKLTGGMFGGDTNSLPWDGQLKGLFHIHNRGLDRVWGFGRVLADHVGTTPKTGVGGQMRHEGEKVKQDIHPGKAA